MDFEHLSPPPYGGFAITEIGISTLSTDEWLQHPTTHRNIIQSRRLVSPNKARRQNMTFRFGESERILRRDIPQFLRDTISHKSPDGTPSKIVLVGHRISAELDIMEKIGIDLRDKELFSIEGILDTVTISKYVGVHFPKQPSLLKLLEFLGIPFQKRWLHNSGNDAHFTLRTLLMLASMAFQKMELDGLSRTRIDYLRSIALAPIDFDSPTPDQESKISDGKAKQSASLVAKQEHGIEDSSNWLDGSEEESLGMTIFRMDAET